MKGDTCVLLGVKEIIYYQLTAKITGRTLSLCESSGTFQARVQLHDFFFYRRREKKNYNISVLKHYLPHLQLSRTMPIDSFCSRASRRSFCGCCFLIIIHNKGEELHRFSTQSISPIGPIISPTIETSKARASSAVFLWVFIESSATGA